jgi:hypothetical protein
MNLPRQLPLRLHRTTQTPRPPNHPTTRTPPRRTTITSLITNTHPHLSQRLWMDKMKFGTYSPSGPPHYRLHWSHVLSTHPNCFERNTRRQSGNTDKMSGGWVIQAPKCEQAQGSRREGRPIAEASSAANTKGNW